MVGYRYGKAPETGKSYNTRDGKQEAGVSMASVAGSPECNSIATLSAKETRKAYYYSGNYAGIGSDDEYILSDCVQITKKEYTKLVKEDSAKKEELKKEACAYYYAELADLTAKKEEIEKSNLEDWQIYAKYGKTIEKMVTDIAYYQSKIARWC